MFNVEIQPSSFCQPFCLWSQEEYRNFMRGCPWEEELKYARAVCDEVGAISPHLFLMLMFVMYLGSNIPPSHLHQLSNVKYRNFGLTQVKSGIAGDALHR